MESDKQEKKHNFNWLDNYKWKKGQSGNPKGRPKGKTLKEFAREYLESLPDEAKLDYLKTLPTEIVWKMSEGNPHQDTNLEANVNIKPDPIYGGKSKEV